MVLVWLEVVALEIANRTVSQEIRSGEREPFKVCRAPFW
jgi:hypothetical protein